MFYELASNSWSKDEYAAINRVVESDRFTMGDQVRLFEEAFAKKFGARYAVMVNSGSSANLVAVAALAFKKERPLQRGDEVIVPAISWATSYYPLQQYGLKLRFVDVEPETLNIDPEKLQAALTPKTRMVLAVSILGNPAALNAIRAFCDANSLYLFEDNCESMGGSVAGKQCGTFGHINTFSTFFSHHISTMEGGVIVTDDRELRDLCISLRSHGWVRGLEKDSPLFEPKDEDFFEAYRFILPGYNVRPIEMAGAIGLEQLKKLDSMIAMRRKNGELFSSLMGDDERFIIQREKHGQSSWFCFTIILNPESGADRGVVMEALKKADIGFRIITGGCFPRHDVIKYFDYDIVGNLDNANMAHDCGFFVGNHPHDLEPQIRRFVDVLDKAAR